MEKKPEDVDVVIDDVKELAKRKLTLLLTVVRPAGFARLVRPEPSPTCLPYTVPAEIVEKKP